MWATIGPMTTERGPELEGGAAEYLLSVVVNDEYDPEFAEPGDLPWVWTIGISEEDAGFGDAVFERGAASSLSAATEACEKAAIDMLLAEGWTIDDIRSASA